VDTGISPDNDRNDRKGRGPAADQALRRHSTGTISHRIPAEIPLQLRVAIAPARLVKTCGTGHLNLPTGSEKINPLINILCGARPTARRVT
jgi:hypothetical protein